MESLSAAAIYTLRFINQTNKSIFLTGKAGTGKTTLLKEIIATTHKNTVVVAPTGIAALNAKSATNEPNAKAHVAYGARAARSLFNGLFCIKEYTPTNLSVTKHDLQRPHNEQV